MIILMFGFGMVAHYAVSVIEEKVVFRRALKGGTQGTVLCVDELIRSCPVRGVLS